MNNSWLIVLILLVLWLAGFFGHVGGEAIHILLIVVVVVVIYNLVQGRKPFGD